MNGEMLITVGICELYGWTLQEYENQPWNFLKVVIEKYKIDGKKQEQQNAKKSPRRG